MTEIFCKQLWEDFPRILLVDDVGLHWHELEVLQGIGYKLPTSFMNADQLLDDMLEQMWQQGLLEQKGLIITPGGGGQRTLQALLSKLEWLDLTPSWEYYHVPTRRIVHHKQPPLAEVGVVSKEVIDIARSFSWIGVLDDVISSGITIRTLYLQERNHFPILWKAFVLCTNLGRGNFKGGGISEVYAGIGLRGVKGRDRIPIATLSGLVEREGWVEQFARKYARYPEQFIKFWRKRAC